MKWPDDIHRSFLFSSGTPFSCDLCKSPYVCKPNKLRNTSKRSRHQPSPRVKTDPSSGTKLTLCNACGRVLLKKCTAIPDEFFLTLLFEKEFSIKIFKSVVLMYVRYYPKVVVLAIQIRQCKFFHDSL